MALKLTPKYEFDPTFYVISIAIILTVGGGFWMANRMIRKYQGKQVQQLVTNANILTPEYGRKQAKNYIVSTVYHRKLSPKEAKKLEEIYADAFVKHQKIWMDDRMQGADMGQTRDKQGVMWREHWDEAERYMKSVGK